ncbi:MAG: DUF2330 domain-containing protein [Bacteroidetes bacterium]|nr:MAG: DUF2330 domain-containing protein [Bacteroidota bacterium]
MEKKSIPRLLPGLPSKSIVDSLGKFLTGDPRHYQIIFLSLFLVYGVFSLHWEVQVVKILLTFSVCIFSQLLFSSFTNRDYTSVKSALISALSLCLMLKTNFLGTAVLAAFLSIAGKFIFRYNGKHIFNPTNFGIIVTIFFSKDAWISPGQWGNSALLVFLLGAMGLLVLLKVKRLDTAFAFLAAFGLYHFIRTVVFLGWSADVFIQSMTSGTLILFTFFMITDPKSTPSAFPARIIWASLIGFLAAYLQIHQWVNGSPLWALFFLSPLTPFFDKYFVAAKFEWNGIGKTKFNPLSGISMNSIVRKRSAMLSIILLMLAVPGSMQAFCGFYVAKADATLFNKSSQVILVRDGDHTVVTMSSDYSGELKDFAMVVPVPVVLKKSDIRVVERMLFDAFDAYSGPRLVEYWDENPCWDRRRGESKFEVSPMAASVAESDISTLKDEERKVTIEAQYVVGEYDILILSAEESSGLEDWLTSNGYRIPLGARDVLEPYIKSGMKFFVVKVNIDGYKKEGAELLRPLQIAFHSPKFMLPIRLGMANSADSQDMIVYALTKNGRVETSNYRTVNMPTDRKVPEFVQENFGKFYADTYSNVVKKEGRRNVFLEYAWDISGNNFMKCDPCASAPPIYSDLVKAGATWLQSNRNGTYQGSVYFTRLHVSYDRANFAQDLVFQETPNKQNFQARYILTHPAPGPFTCDEGKAYLQELRKKRYRELQELHSLTGWDIKKYGDYLQEAMGYTLPLEPMDKKNVAFIDPPRKSVKKPNAFADTSKIITQVTFHDSLSMSFPLSDEQENYSEAGNAAKEPEYEIIFAVLALGLLYYLERRRK